MKRSKTLLLHVIVSCIYVIASAQNQLKVPPLDGEKWWGGVTALGTHMPFDSKTDLVDMEHNNRNNQTAPLLLSSKGRYIWAQNPFIFKISGDKIGRAHV